MNHPTYSATPEEYAQFGVNLNWIDQIKLLSQWAPLLSYAQAYSQQSDPYKRSIVIADGVEWVASKTQTPVDDQAVRLIADLLKTPQGEALIRWCLLKVEEAK